MSEGDVASEVAGETSDRVYMVKNDSDDVWSSVQITINGRYFMTADQLRPYGDITLSPRLMANETEKEAPSNLVITEIHVSCSEGDAYLLRNGQPQ